MPTISQLTLQVPRYLAFLAEKERADATVQKYNHEVEAFLCQCATQGELPGAEPCTIQRTEPCTAQQKATQSATKNTVLCTEPCTAQQNTTQSATKSAAQQNTTQNAAPEAGEVYITKQTVLAYKHYLTLHYKPAGVNCKLAAVNGFLAFCGLHGLQVQQLKVQRNAFCGKNKELTKQEYQRLLQAAQKQDERLFMLLQTICSTGIRVSELPFITVHSLRTGRAAVTCKNKTRSVLLPKTLCTRLQGYCRRRGIARGSVFVTSGGKPLDRSNIWAMMKRLCAAAHVSKSKVFPHNLRHLFARTFYAAQKDLVKLADVLGHARIDTTRIYTICTGSQHERILNGLGLLATFPNTEEYLRL